MLTREAVIAQARTYLGAPFRHQGRSRETGLDCIGLILCPLRDLGWEGDAEAGVKRLDYPRWPDSRDLVRAVESGCVQIELSQALPGDMMLMMWKEVDEFPRHMAWITEVSPMRILHTHWLMPRHQVSEHLFADPWPSRLVSVWRLKEFV